jgi:hypothetical protein
MRLVILETPFSGRVEANIAYAKACIGDCLRRGESPIASHLLYTQPGILNDAVPTERALGIDAGHAWYRVAQACVVYTDHGLSTGMLAGMAVARRHAVPIEHRTLPGWFDAEDVAAPIDPELRHLKTVVASLGAE